MKKPPKSNGLFPACLKFDLKMKLSLLFFVTASFVMQASISYSQKTKISLNKESVTVKEVIDEIETTTEFKFLFNTKSVDLNRKVTLNVKKVPVNIILDLLFKGTDTSYEIDDRKILLTKTKENKVIMISQPNLPDLPPVQIKGTIVDSNGQPLPSANVVEKGTKTGVTTDFDGKFALNVSNENAILIISYIGFDTQEVSLKGQATIKIVLKESAAGLNEVVVVGYGTQKKHDITGSVSSINKNSIKDLVLTSTEQALKGQAAGVQMTQSSSAPGGGASVRIRGGNSISAGNEPLYVIDGFPIYNDNSNSTGVLGNGQPTNVLASINPSDIESMEILKDASATAIYGARGANGVIIITTKRGKTGQTSVNFETYYGFQQLSKKIDLVNAYDFARNANVDNVQRARPIIYPDPEIYNPAVYGQGTDWQDEAFRVAPTQNYQLGFTGGNEQTKYAISGNYFTQDGILRGSDFTRGSVRVNLDQNLSSKFKLGLSFTASRTANNQAKTDTDLDANNIGAVTSILYAPPTAPVYAPDGSYNRFIGPDGSFYGNPVASLLEIKNLSRTDRVMGNIFLDYKITKDLLFKISFGGDQINVKDDYYMPAFIQNTGQNAKARIGVNQSFSWLNENTLTYTKTFAAKHNFTALGGFTRQKFTAENVTTGADKFVNDVLGDGSLGTGAIVVPPTSNVNEWALESYIARINYGYDNRYLVTLTGRADGSSRFGESNKFSFFPSGSVAWRVSEEDFMKSTQKIISNLKLRTSYGQTGNTEIPTYRSLAALGGTSNYPIGGVITSGVASTRVANPNLKWETTSQFDAGVDLSLFSNRINFVADYYDKRTKDLLLDVQIPGTSGYQTSLQNVGSVRNHGIELALNTVNFDGDFKWKTSFNITFNKNEVTDLGGDYERPAGGGSASKAIANTGILRVGEPVGLFYGYVTDGLFQTQAEVDAGIASGQAGVKLGDRRYKDINGDGKLDAKDRAILGYAQPDFFYGMTNTFSYKNFDLNVLINGVQGNDVLNLNVNAETDINAPGSNNRWTPTNTNTDVPRTTKETRLTNKQVEDGSYLRIQNISFGYEMPKIVFKNTFVESIRLYVSLQNYFTFTNYKGYNPDVNSFGQDNLSIGVDRGGYPAAKTFLMGLNVKL
ncbi:SusC/RagA family TonB-linked outer membrane protein [Flavobacterium pectinovorum]|uniref:SusC/RagA family TonB-linked outer membrane protein n=2 Tax=Flavobacterium pectinovorum TaxID=29533 RepID=A0A502EAD5_9FLAO|nr:SusC/RagA family TonB-linked outer membrane protein [Flavobacterium pectinovorum]